MNKYLRTNLNLNLLNKTYYSIYSKKAGFFWGYQDYAFIGIVCVFFGLLWLNILLDLEIYWLENFLIFNLEVMGIPTDNSPGIIATSSILIKTNNTITGEEYLKVSLILSVLYGVYYFKGIALRLLYIIINLFFVLLLNKLRVLFLVLYAHYYGLSEVVAISCYVSWGIYALLLSTFYVIGKLLKAYDT